MITLAGVACGMTLPANVAFVLGQNSPSAGGKLPEFPLSKPL